MDADTVFLETQQAMRRGDLDVVRELLHRHPDLVRYDRGGTLLQIAAYDGNLQMVKLLIQLGSDVNARQKYGEYVLFYAVGSDHPEILRTVLSSGADVTRAEESNRLVICAITGRKKHSLELVKLLEEYGADLHRVFVNELANEPMNALSTAVDWEKQDVADYLRSKGAVMPDLERERPPKSVGEDVVAYCSQEFGPVRRQALIEIVPSSWPAIAIHAVEASKDRPFLTLFTTGMSSEPMETPWGEERFQLGEVFVQLPHDWQYRKIEDPNWGWPIRWLRCSAQYAHVHHTALGATTTIANDDPTNPLGANTRFTSVLLLAEKNFISRDSRTVHLYRMVPLYPEEQNLVLKRGAPALMRAFDRYNTPFVVAVNRPNVGVLEGETE